MRFFPILLAWSVTLCILLIPDRIQPEILIAWGGCVLFFVAWMVPRSAAEVLVYLIFMPFSLVFHLLEYIEKQAKITLFTRILALPVTLLTKILGSITRFGKMLLMKAAKTEKESFIHGLENPFLSEQGFKEVYDQNLKDFRQNYPEKRGLRS